MSPPNQWNAGTCPETLNGEPCIHPLGAEGHPMVRTYQGLGLPSLIHRTRAGVRWANGRVLP